MSYTCRSKENNQFLIDHAWPGLCSLCHDEIATFSGSNKNGKPKIDKLKNNYKTIKVMLNDNSHMSVQLCKDCYSNIDESDLPALTESEYLGWKSEVDNNNNWSIEKKQSYLERYKTKTITEILIKE